MLSKNLENSINRALVIANNMMHEYATVEHLLMALVDDPDVREALIGCGVNLPQLQEELMKFITVDLQAIVISSIQEAKPSSSLLNVLQSAIIKTHASRKNSETCGVSVLAQILSEDGSHAAFLLGKHSLTEDAIKNFILNKNSGGDSSGQPSQNVGYITPIGFLSEDFESISKGFQIKGPKNEPMQDKEDPLGNYCINLNEKARRGEIDSLVGRRKEIDRIIEVLSRRTKSNPLLVGDPGVGKTAMLEGLALLIVKGLVPKELLGMVIYSLDMGALIAGARYRGDFEERIKVVISRIAANKNNVLYIDEIHTIIGAGATSGGSIDASNLLKPVLARGDIRCIGATTHKEYSKHFEKDRALVRRFQKIDVSESSSDETVKILEGIKSYYEKFHNIKYTASALRAAVDLSVRYITDKTLPDKAIDVIDEAGAHCKINYNYSVKARNIGVKDIEDAISRITGIPCRRLSMKESERIKLLDYNIKQKIYGQDDVISVVVQDIKIAKSGLNRAEKPMGCYLFVGPTGVGKTELSKQLSELLDMNLIRIDMSEYMEAHTVARMIGSPPGYVGHEEGGLLTDSVIKNPYSILLLDEIEKAHGDVYNVLLQLMDYGSVTDATGRQVNFRNTILIMTTNAGSSDINKLPIGFSRGKEFNLGEGQKAVERLFSPEFINRLDKVVHFKPLSKKVIKNVIQKFMAQLQDLLTKKNIKLNVKDSVYKYLADKGFSEDYGARPIERIINEEIKTKLSEEILFNRLKRGGVVDLEYKLGKLQMAFKSHAPKSKAKSASRKEKSGINAS